MTILQALAQRYGRLKAGGAAPGAGFGPAQVAFAIVLKPDGKVVTVDDLRTGDKKRRPRVIEAPQPPKRTVGVASGAFWDKTSYVLGRTTMDPKLPPDKQERAQARTAAEHRTFKARHESLLAGSDDVGALALLRFLRGWSSDQYDSLDHAEAMVDQNVVFRLDGERGFIHDRMGVRTTLDKPDNSEGPGATCLVMGRSATIARLHPSIKGVPGAQSSGAALVSFNLDAFNSYGKTQGFNAPVSEEAAFAYATALNALISAQSGVDAKGRTLWANRVNLGADTVVFWAETEAAEAVARLVLGPPSPTEATETDAIRTSLQRLEAGDPIETVRPDVDPSTRVYVLGLSPNAARLSVRFWLDQSLGDFTRHMRDHWRDLRIEPAPVGEAPKLWALLYEIAPLRKIDKGIEHLAGEMTRALLSGASYPASLLTQALMRVRVEKDKTTPVRVALIKAVLARRARKADPQWKDNLVALDRDAPNIGYRLGRLFAVLEAAQYAGIGAVNASVKDKFFGAASATPGHVFPLLLRGAQNHLSAARKKGKGGRAFRLDGEISEILGGVDPQKPFPPTLTLEDQGRFVIGFYHQDADLRVPRTKNEEVDVKSADTLTADSEDDR